MDKRGSGTGEADDVGLCVGRIRRQNRSEKCDEHEERDDGKRDERRTVAPNARQHGAPGSRDGRGAGSWRQASRSRGSAAAVRMSATRLPNATIAAPTMATAVTSA